MASKVSEAQREQLRLWATAEPLTARQLVSRLKEEFDISIHPNTLGVIFQTDELRVQGYAAQSYKNVVSADLPKPGWKST